MRVMAAMSPTAAGLMRGSLIAWGPKNKAPRNRSGAPSSFFSVPLAAVAKQAQQHEEQVDKVEVEPERAHHRLAAGNGAVVHRAIHLLDALRVVGGQADEDDHADHRDDPIEPA